MMRGPGPPPPPETNENKPAIRPLMSLSPPPLPIGQAGFDFGLDDDSWKGTPDRRGRKRSGEQEGFRDGDRGPPKAIRPEDDWRRGPGKNVIQVRGTFHPLAPVQPPLLSSPIFFFFFLREGGMLNTAYKPSTFQTIYNRFKF